MYWHALENVDHIQRDTRKFFCVLQPAGSNLTKHSQPLTLKTLSPLLISIVLQCEYPFSILDGDEPSQECKVRPDAWHFSSAKLKSFLKRWRACLFLILSHYGHSITHAHTHTTHTHACTQLVLKPESLSCVTVQFDSTYCVNRKSCQENKKLKITYLDHPHEVSFLFYQNFPQFRTKYQHHFPPKSNVLVNALKYNFFLNSSQEKFWSSFACTYCM